MLRDLVDRLLRPLGQGPATARHPTVPPDLAPAARGLPVLDPARCEGSGACVDVCPTRAISVTPASWRLDLGRCVFCGACADACPVGAITLAGRVELAARQREAIVVETAVGGRP
jgi:formate hydrogenlyase subunit 6/NADH:ubiquinone oxidoreductase subunit I